MNIVADTLLTLPPLSPACLTGICCHCLHRPTRKPGPPWTLNMALQIWTSLHRNNQSLPSKKNMQAMLQRQPTVWLIVNYWEVGSIALCPLLLFFSHLPHRPPSSSTPHFLQLPWIIANSGISSALQMGFLWWS